ncbi:hypothetical protein ACHAPT_009792 [Fusarium lateritium]
MSESVSSDDFKRPEQKAREAEYQALWQVCDRTSRKSEYKYGDYTTRRAILEEACHALMNRRRNIGKQLCNTSIPEMVERHLKREAHSRIIHEARVTGQLRDSPAPTAPLVMNDPHHMAALSSGPHVTVPYGNMQPYATNVDTTPFALRNEIVVLRQEVARLHEDRQIIVSNMRALGAHVVSMENELAEMRGEATHGRFPFNELDVNLRGGTQPRSVPVGDNGFQLRATPQLGESGLHLRATPQLGENGLQLRATPQLGENSLHLRATPQLGEHDPQMRVANQMKEGDVHFRPTNYTHEGDARPRAGLFPQSALSGLGYPDEGIEGPVIGPRPQRQPMTPRSQTHGRDDSDREIF